MIFGDLKAWEQEKHLYPAAVRRGLEFLQSRDWESVEKGKYPIEGDLMFALVQELDTEPLAQRKPESHITHTDIQFLIRGEEKIGVCRWSPELVVAENRLETDDYALYDSVAGESELVLQPGQFAVFFPWDVHRPCCQVKESMPIKKVVVKIHKQLWQE
ncbi:YhcH/YjgK/YiaL family protein [Paenibacillus hamazuiensis]|uniref:YhcH/YjgK/YiaL family protein n=1 Tax=Paenibacillus hamazuiensis TaxID=2936508 RepID=UPI0020107C92|nr:YhcH/YjgK/YiaL family protein [Paenibacillus hamazuiensis]